jgi:16S rRNA (uracil1498-N3)-methyltransferase
VPLETTRGVAQPVSGALDRLRRSVVEASKQCGRNRLMEVAEPQSLATFLKQSDQVGRWFAQPGGTQLRQIFARQQAVRPSSLFIAVGPEGGFTDDEAAQAVAADWQFVGLGDRILRIETAAAVLAAMGCLLGE